MNIKFKNVSKKFGAKKVIKNFSKSFQRKKYAIIGDNGSGKSTLLQLISNLMTPSDGKIIYSLDDVEIDKEVFIGKIIFSAPYQKLVEELTVEELVELQLQAPEEVEVDYVQPEPQEEILLSSLQIPQLSLLQDNKELVLNLKLLKDLILQV